MAVVLLALAYALVGALILAVWIVTRWHLAVKVALVVVVSLLYSGTYLTIREIQGWPASEPPPDTFRLLWASVEEPDKLSGTRGQISLWTRRLGMNGEAEGEPRAYRLPYRVDLA